MENIVKLIGASLIMLSGTLLGWICSLYYTNRVKELENLRTALVFLENEIKLNHRKLSQALKLAGNTVQTPISNLLFRAAKKLTKIQGKEFYLIMQEVIESEKNNTNLLKEDLDILLEWSRQVDSTSLEGQFKIHKSAIKKLEFRINDARNIADKKVKLSRYTGTLLSLLIIILFY